MRKTQELSDPTSCLNKARPDEILFVLLARDAAAPVAIESWVAERLRLGKNQPADAQITEALAAADAMREQQDAAAWASHRGLSMREQEAFEGGEP